MNMYTVPAWRGHGLASATLQEMITYAKRMGARRIWLHATPAGRPVYEKAGFVLRQSEMELTW
jgi:GNAT superfamily N-acetyltransferase